MTSKPLATFLICLAAAGAAFADAPPAPPAAPRVLVYLDCDSCDFDFVRREVAFVDWARQRQDADVHVLVLRETAGSGGDAYTLDFHGQRGFAGVDDTLRFPTPPNTSEDAVRHGMARTLALGLARYVARTPGASEIGIAYSPRGMPAAAPARDRWDSWVFNIGLNAYLNGERRQSSQSLWGSFTAGRVTEQWKVNLGGGYSYDENEFEIPGATIRSTSRSAWTDALVVRSLGPHWSAGLTAHAWSSTFSNVDGAASFAPAIEYNVFPYAESTRRQFTVRYAIGARWFDYAEQTIYFKRSETRAYESLTALFDTRRTWGSVHVVLSLSNYLHDFSKYRAGLTTSLRLNLAKGFSFDVYGSYSRVHDQLSLARGGATLDEVLLRRRELETSYYYYCSIGVSYSFGATSNNVVNPRFGSE